ncbi:class I SAM-dependent methyltransferase [Oerskovia turbata]
MHDAGEDRTEPLELDTTSEAYTRRLHELQGAWWKRALHVQAPYRWNMRRTLGSARTLDLGCGIGRNLGALSTDSVGVDHNATSVAFCRTRGLTAYTPAEFHAWAASGGARFDGLLVSHVLEHLPSGSQSALLAEYLPYLSPGSAVLLVCPQERGYASDASHVDFVDSDRMMSLCCDLGLKVQSSTSFPFPRALGSAFVYNEFVVVARTPGAPAARDVPST